MATDLQTGIVSGIRMPRAVNAKQSLASMEVVIVPHTALVAEGPMTQMIISQRLTVPTLLRRCYTMLWIPL